MGRPDSISHALHDEQEGRVYTHIHTINQSPRLLGMKMGRDDDVRGEGIVGVLCCTGRKGVVKELVQLTR